MTVSFIGVDRLRCAVHNEPTIYYKGMLSCVKRREHTECTRLWVSQSRTREIMENARSDNFPMYIEGDNGMIFKHERSGWWEPADDEQRELMRRVRSTRSAIGVQPRKFVHLLTRKLASGRAVLDVYGPTLCDADSSLLARGAPLRFGITEDVRTARVHRRGDNVLWRWVEQYPAESPPTDVVAAARVRKFWADDDAHNAALDLELALAQQSEGQG